MMMIPYFFLLGILLLGRPGEGIPNIRHQRQVVDSLFGLRKELSSIITELRRLRENGDGGIASHLSGVIKSAKSFQRDYMANVRILRHIVTSDDASDERRPSQRQNIRNGTEDQNKSCLYLFDHSPDGSRLIHWERHPLGAVRGCTAPGAVIGWRCMRSNLKPDSTYWRPVLCSNHPTSALDSPGQPGSSDGNPGACLDKSGSIHREGSVDCSGNVLRQCRRVSGDTSRSHRIVHWSVDVVGCHTCPSNPRLNTCCYKDGAFYPVGAVLLQCASTRGSGRTKGVLYRCESDRLSSWSQARHWVPTNITIPNSRNCTAKPTPLPSQDTTTRSPCTRNVDQRRVRFSRELTTVWQYRRPSADFPCPYANKWYRLGHIRCDFRQRNELGMVRSFMCKSLDDFKEVKINRSLEMFHERLRSFFPVERFEWQENWSDRTLCATAARKNASDVSIDSRPTMSECHDDQTGRLYQIGENRCSGGKVYRCRKGSSEKRAGWVLERKRCVVCKTDPNDPVASFLGSAYGTCCFHADRFFSPGSHVCRYGRHLRCRRTRLGTSANSLNGRCERNWVDEGSC